MHQDNAHASHQTVRLSPGRHDDPDQGACVVELASMLAGERFSDHPDCVSPVVAAFLRGYNDTIDDPRRQQLYPLAGEIVGSAASRGREPARVGECREWARGLYRSQLGWWLRPRYGDELLEVEAIGARAGQRAGWRTADDEHLATLEFARGLIGSDAGAGHLTDPVEELDTAARH
jgi:hypothetical protein